jgi:hypothetical protein
VSIGANRQLNRSLRAEVNGGIDASHTHHTTWLYPHLNLTATWQVSRATTASLTGQTGLSAYFYTAETVKEQRIGLTLAKAFWDYRINTSLAGRYYHGHYLQTPILLDLTEVDADVQLKLTKRIALGAAYRFAYNRANRSYLNFTRNVLSLGTAVQL